MTSSEPGIAAAPAPGVSSRRSVVRRLTGARTWQAMGYRNFRFLWLGQISNSASLWTEQVARPLLIIHLVPDPAQAALHIAFVLAARATPQFGFGLLGGVFADWYDRRHLLLVSKAASTSIQIVMALLLLLGMLELWHIYATTALRGISTSFDQPARHALIPSLVPSQILSNAVALNSAGIQVMRIGGAPLAGMLILAFGFAGAFVAVAVFGATAFIFTYLLETPRQEHVDGRGARAAAASFKDGLRYGWAQPGVRGPLLIMLAYFVLGMTYLQVFAPLLATHVLKVGDGGYALMVSSAGVGAVLGLLVMASMPPVPRPGLVMLAAMAVLGVLLVAFGASTYSGALLITYALVAGVGLVQSALFALANTMLMESTEPRMRGRIMGLLSLDRSMIAAGGVLGGLLAATVGPQIGQMVLGFACVAFALLLSWTLPGMRRVA